VRGWIAHLAREPVGSKQEVAEPVGDHAVDLFGHAQVVRSQSRLNVAAADTFLFRGDGACQRGVHITYHHDPIGFFTPQDLLELDHSVSHLFGMAARTNPEVDIGHRDVQVGKEMVRHPVVVMLACVDQDGINVGGARHSAPTIGLHCYVMSFNGPDKRRYLHKIWAGTDNRENLHGKLQVYDFGFQNTFDWSSTIEFGKIGVINDAAPVLSQYSNALKDSLLV